MTIQLNVGVDLDQFDQFRYLPKRWVMDNEEVTINLFHTGADQLNPRLHNSSFELLNDSIDVYLHPAMKATNAVVPMFGNISMQLWEKPTQLGFLNRLKATNRHELLEKFYAQQYVCVIPNSERQQAKRQFSQMQRLGDRFVIRPNLGANGLGVKVIEGDLIPKTIAELNSVEWISKIASSQEELDKYSSAGFHFCELIEGATEVRIVRTIGNDMLAAVRSKNETESSFGLDLGRVKSDYTPILKDALVDLPINCDQVNKLIEEIFPMQRCGSYDLWVTPDGTFGLYEFSTQFALNCCEPVLREDFMKFYVQRFLELSHAV